MLGEYAGGIDLAYQNAVAAQDPALAQTVSQEALPGESWVNAALRVAQAYTLADSQRRLLNIQMQRAAQGLPPLNSSQYGLGVNVGLSPDTTKMIGLGVLGLGLLYLLARKRRG